MSGGKRQATRAPGMRLSIDLELLHHGFSSRCPDEEGRRVAFHDNFQGRTFKDVSRGLYGLDPKPENCTTRYLSL